MGGIMVTLQSVERREDSIETTLQAMQETLAGHGRILPRLDRVRTAADQRHRAQEAGVRISMRCPSGSRK